MTVRKNGYVHVGLENVQGNNGFLSIAVDGTDATGTPIASTGVVSTLAGFKELHGLESSENISTLEAEVRTFEGVAANGRPGTTAALTDDDAYVVAWSRQANLTRLINFIQQRGVIMASSLIEEGATITDTSVTNDYDQAIADADVVTFMVQDPDAFLFSTPVAGVPQVEAIDTLRTQLESLPLYKEDGTEKGSAGTPDTARSLALKETLQVYVA